MYINRIIFKKKKKIVVFPKIEKRKKKPKNLNKLHTWRKNNDIR
ncbi:unnamed protein product [Arabidopsis halleri]